MSEVKTHTGTLYDYQSACFCGVLIKENVMRKLAALQHQHLEQVKRLLADEADKGNVFSSMWALHYPDGKQTVVKYIDTSADIQQRIKTATHAAQPIACPLVFIANSMDEASRMADARHAELNPGVVA